MVAVAYTTDLEDVVLEFPNTTGWTLISSGGGGQNSLTAPETDDYIQGNNSISRNPFSSSIRGMIYGTTNRTIATLDGIFIWWKADVSQSLATKANGGVQLLTGSGTAAFKAYYIDGSDTYQKGGWKCSVINPNIAQDDIVGSPVSGTNTHFGVRWNVPGSGPSKGFPFKIDAIRIGQEFAVTGGDSANGYANFSDIADYQEDTTRRLGFLQRLEGPTFILKGRLALGTTTNSVDFRDSSVSIFIEDVEKVSPNFNSIEIYNDNSNLELNNVLFQSLGTYARCAFLIQASATIKITSSIFVNLNAFTVFPGVSTSEGSFIRNTTFRNSGTVTCSPNCELSGCIFDSSIGTTALSSFSNSQDFSNFENLEFISSGTGHGLTILGTIPSNTITLKNFTFTGYAATNGTTGNEAVFFNLSAGSYTVNVDTSFSYRAAVGVSINLVVGQKTLSVINVVSGSDIVILAAGTSSVLASNDGATNPVTSFNYSYTYTPNTFVDICVYLAGYVPYVIRNFLLPIDGGSVQVAQIIDRNFFDPLPLP